jgi:hypothetical protein
MSTQLISKQLSMRHLRLPLEIIHLMFDFSFMDPIMANSKRRKNIIIKLINTTIWCGRARPMDEQDGTMVFWIEDDQGSPQLQPTFCIKCGN